MAEKIIQRIDGILKQINRVQKELENVSFESFQQFDLLPEAISFSIAQVGERMNKLEELIGDKYPELPWKEARKMRNQIVHDYDAVNFKLVYFTATNDLPILKDNLLKIKCDILQINKHSLETKRLFLRPWNDFDVDELFDLAKDPEIGKCCGWEPHKHIKDSLFALHNFLELEETYAICLKDNNKIIGSIGLNLCGNTHLTNKIDECELGFWIGKQYWNNGYATEAGEELLRYAFEKLKMRIVWCSYYQDNGKSKRVQEKLGFKYCYKNKNKIINNIINDKI